jgi:hypothetical protein
MELQERREILSELGNLVERAAELAHRLGRGYREDQINASLTGTEGEFFGDGLPDWIGELRERLDEGDKEEE